MRTSQAEAYRELNNRRQGTTMGQHSKVIEDLQEELERSGKIIKEQKHLIEILKEGKDFYELQYKKNEFEGEFVKLQQENHRLSLIAGTHRTINQELNEEMLKLQEEAGQREKTMKEMERVNNENQEKYLGVVLQKKIIEKEWNKVVKAVKKKMAIILSQGTSNPEMERQHLYNEGYKSKENYNQTTKQAQSVPFDRQMTLKERADNMIKEINSRLAIGELEQLFDNQTSEKKIKSMQNSPQSRQALRQLDRNEMRVPFNIEFY